MLPHADAAFFSDADTPMTPDVDDPMIPGNNAAPGSQWYRRVRLGILITQFPAARFQMGMYVDVWAKLSYMAWGSAPDALLACVLSNVFSMVKLCALQAIS